MATEITGRNYEIPPDVRDMVQAYLLLMERGRPGEAAKWRAARAKYPFVAPPPRQPTPSRTYNLPPRRAQQLFGRENDLTALEAILTPGTALRVTASVDPRSQDSCHLRSTPFWV